MRQLHFRLDLTLGITERTRRPLKASLRNISCSWCTNSKLTLFFFAKPNSDLKNVHPKAAQFTKCKQLSIVSSKGLEEFVCFSPQILQCQATILRSNHGCLNVVDNCPSCPHIQKKLAHGVKEKGCATLAFDKRWETFLPLQVRGRNKTQPFFVVPN